MAREHHPTPPRRLLGGLLDLRDCKAIQSLLNAEKPGINTSFGRHPRFADNKTGELPLLMKKTMLLDMGVVGQIFNGAIYILSLNRSMSK
jgi:hypothetical protein